MIKKFISSLLFKQNIEPEVFLVAGILHGDEIAYIFGQPLNKSYGYSEKDKKLSRTMMKFWANFAKTGYILILFEIVSFPNEFSQSFVQFIMGFEIEKNDDVQQFHSLLNLRPFSDILAWGKMESGQRLTGQCILHLTRFLQIKDRKINVKSSYFLF